MSFCKIDVDSIFMLAMRLIVAATVSLLLVFTVNTKAHAENERVHALMVNEALRFIRSDPESAKVYEFLRQAGIEDAIISDLNVEAVKNILVPLKEVSMHGTSITMPFPEAIPVPGYNNTCFVVALMEGPDDNKAHFNPLSYEACYTDYYTDMKVNLFGTDFEDIVMKVEEHLHDVAGVAIAITGLKHAGGVVKCIKKLLKFKKCKTDLDDVRNFFDDLLQSNIDLIASGASLGLLPIEGGIDLFTGDLLITELGGMHFTSFNHLANYTMGPWYTPPPSTIPLLHDWTPKNDYPGYFRPKDVSMVDIPPDESDILRMDGGGFKREIGFMAVDILGSKIDYDQSSAAQRYRLNGSRISKANYSSNTIRATEFEPLDNMGTYGFNQALNTGDLTFIARTLHAAGDTAVSFHVLAQGGSEHTNYEDYIHSNWETHTSAWVNQAIIRDYLYNKFVNYGDIDDMLTLCGLETLRVTEGLFTNAGSEKRISIGVACIVAVFHKFYNIANTHRRPLYAYNISIYPYPQSTHPMRGGETVTWVANNICNSQYAKFISNDAGPSTIKRESLIRFLPDQAKTPVFLPGGTPLFVSELESMGWVDMRKGYGFRVLSSVPSATSDEARPGWGFRVKQIGCKVHDGYKSPFLPD